MVSGLSLINAQRNFNFKLQSILFNFSLIGCNPWVVLGWIFIFKMWVQVAHKGYLFRGHEEREIIPFLWTEQQSWLSGFIRSCTQIALQIKQGKKKERLN